MTTLSLLAADRGTYVVRCAFSDEDGADVVPDTLTWTLTDAAGTVINSREDVAVAVPAATVDLVLSGDDLDFADGEVRVVTVEATYTSTLGAGLPLKAQARFGIEDLIAVTTPEA